MMGTSNKILIAVVMVALAGVIVYDVRYYYGGKERASAHRSVYSADGPRAGRFPEPRLELLDQPRPEYNGVKRDIFGPFTTGPVKKPAVKAVPVKAEPPPLPPVIEPPTPPAPPSRIKVFASGIKFVGFLEKTTQKAAFFSKGEDVFILKRGDTVEQFRVTDLTESFIAFRDDESGEGIKVELLR